MLVLVRGSWTEQVGSLLPISPLAHINRVLAASVSTMRLRFSYSPSIDYSFGTTALLAAAWLLTGAALVVFNFITQAKQQVCVATPTTHYDAGSCPPASLAFWETYWTMPLSGNVTVGT